MTDRDDEIARQFANDPVFLSGVIRKMAEDVVRLRAEVERLRESSLVRTDGTVELFGIPLKVIAGCPDDEVTFWQNGKVVGRILLDRDA